MTEIKDRIRSWWANNPMTYGQDHGSTTFIDKHGKTVSVEYGSREFFTLADETFYSWNAPLHGPDGPFSELFPFQKYHGKKVLEVGCGMGCMAMAWANNGANISAVDLNPVAIEQTRRRFEIFDLQGDIKEADGESLPFDDNSFDYAYSWGVLHHSPDTARSVAELLRVLKPGGEAGVMLYNRNSILHAYQIRWVEGFLNMESRFLNDKELASRYSDGGREEGNPFTWPVTRSETGKMLLNKCEDLNITTLGTDVPFVLDHLLPDFGGKSLSQRMLNALAKRWGWSLWITFCKPLPR